MPMHLPDASLCDADASGAAEAAWPADLVAESHEQTLRFIKMSDVLSDRLWFASSFRPQPEN